jgi:hypothetical protein
VKRWLGKLLLAFWAVGVLFGMAALSFGHISAMPDPEARLARELLALRSDPGSSFYVHVISADCSCTQRLFAHLVERARFAGANELVLFVGRDPARQAAAERAGMRFVSASPEQLAARYGIEAAPLLAAFDAGGRLTYLGGYYDHPSTVFPRDEKIHAELAGGGAAAPLPVFGCAVSARLQKSVDPLGVVYERK